MRGKFLTLTILIQFILLAIYLLLALAFSDFARGPDYLPDWLNITNNILGTTLSIAGLFYIWKMKKIGVYLFFVPFILELPLLFIPWYRGELSAKLTFGTLLLTILLQSIFAWAIKRKWKAFR